MKENLLCCSAAVYLILLLVVSAVHCDGENVGSSSSVVKTRRGSSGLIPMGRVGRGGIPWTFQPSDEDVGPGTSLTKFRRGSSGLISMPRVGRGNIPWTFQISGVEDEKSKRGSSGMIPFPRVGRSDFLAHFPIADSFLEDGEAFVSVPGKRSEGGSGEANGMWFGPRLGKRSKRAADYPWAVVKVKEFPGNRRYGGFTPRLGRESSENEEEDEGFLEEDDSQNGKNNLPAAGAKTHNYN